MSQREAIEAAASDVTPEQQRAYESARQARSIVSATRETNRLKRARSGRDRDAAASLRDRTATARDQRTIERNADASDAAG